jgi:hypothetical protein
VDDPALIRDLRAQLVDEILANPDSAMIDAILPDNLIEAGDDRSIRYILFPRERRSGQGNVTLAMMAIGRLLRQMGDGDGKTITSLPLFSRISMVNEARRVSTLVSGRQSLSSLDKSRDG